MNEQETDLEDLEGLDSDISQDNYNIGGFDSFGDYGYGSESNIAKHSDLLKDLTNFDPIVQNRIRNWLGLEWDEEAKKYEKKNEAIINLKGAKWAMGVLSTYQAKPNIITNLAHREYQDIRIEIIDLCWLVFATKFDEFEVKTPADQYRLSQELQHSAFLVLAGAGDGKYTKFLGESVHRTESVNMSGNQQMGMQPMYPAGNMMHKDSFLESMKNKLMGRK